MTQTIELSVFDFNYPDIYAPVTLGLLPTATKDGRLAIERHLKRGCRCRHTLPRTATLRQRGVGKGVSVYIQCDACGASIGSPLPRNAFPGWHNLPGWVEGQYEAFNEARLAFRWARTNESLVAHEIDLREQSVSYATRQAEYAEWCENSEEWHALRKLIMWRSRGICEACLAKSATVVHHMTYQLGVLPPAWYLRATCDDCHSRLHTAGDDWCVQGMAREQPAVADWEF